MTELQKRLFDVAGHLRPGSAYAVFSAEDDVGDMCQYLVRRDDGMFTLIELGGHWNDPQTLGVPVPVASHLWVRDPSMSRECALATGAKIEALTEALRP